MRDKYCIILLDKTEIIIQVYEKLYNGSLLKIYDKQYEKASYKEKAELNVADVVEIIAQSSLAKEVNSALEWKIYARGISDETVRKISYITNIKAEILTLTKEQNLICKALVAGL